MCFLLSVSDRSRASWSRVAQELQRPFHVLRAWHHHGNWWSRQRHLKARNFWPLCWTCQVDNAPTKKDIGDVRRRPPTDVTQLQQSRLASTALAAAKNQQAGLAKWLKVLLKAPAGKGSGRGKGGRGMDRRGKHPSISFDRGRQHRERGALSSLDS